MELLVCAAMGLLGLIGFVIGYFFQAKVLIFISIFFLITVIYSWIKAQEVAKILALVYSCGAIAITLIMWVTWYHRTNMSFVGELLRKHILS